MHKKPPVLSKLLNLCVEKLWFVLLLTPLLIIAIIMINHFQPNERQQVNRSVALVVGSVEISATELASIVTKPLSELIAMEVYSAINNGSVAAASVGIKQFRDVSDNRLTEIKRARDNPIRVISYATTKKTTTRIIREAS